VNLVNKDQVDILASLRASVGVEKEALTKQVDAIQAQLKEAELKNQMQLSQINTLLMDKATLQTDSIEQRERALQREKDVR
jgi:protein HOOK3